MPTYLGNFGRGTSTMGSGGGTDERRTPFGHITIAGKAGEVARISSADLYPKFDQIFRGITVQAVGGSVKIEATLAPIALAVDPVQDSSGIWIIENAVFAPGTILTLPYMASALKVTWLSDGYLYLMGV